MKSDAELDADQDDGTGAWASAGLGLVEIAWQRKQLVALGIVVALVIAVVYFSQARRIYESTAQVLIVKKRPDSVTGLDTRHLAIEDYVSTHQALIRSPLIVDGAIRKRNLQDLKCFADETENLTEVVIKALSVSRNRSTGTNNNVLVLSYRAVDAEDASVILGAVIESYKNFLDETYRNTSDDTLKLITQGRDLLLKELTKQEDAYRNFLREAPLFAVRRKQGGSLRQERLSVLEAKLSLIMVRKTEVEGYFRAVEAAMKQGTGREAILAMASEWANRSYDDGPRLRQPLSMQDQLYPLLLEEKKLVETRGDNHPDVIALRNRIDTTREFLSSPSAAWRPADGEIKRTQPTDPVKAYHEHFKMQLNNLEIGERLLGDLLKNEYDSAKELTRYEIEEEGLRTNLDRTKNLYDGIIKRLQDVDLIKDMGGYDARTIASPMIGKKVLPSPIIIFPVACILGTLLGFGLAYLAELSDKSFRSVQEVRRQLGLPVVGHVPHLEPVEETLLQPAADGHPLDAMLYCHHRPLSVEAESYRGVRTAIYFSTQGQGHKVIQVTSPSGGDGKSTLAANLAVSIAQSGKTVILIDADLRKPRVHKIFGVSAAVGLGSIISEGKDLPDAVQASGISGLSILPCGPIPPNPAELLTSPRFKELLDVIREKYDYVIVDTPPLLAVTDPAVVAPRVDGLLLTIRLTKNGRPLAHRAKDVLDGIRSNVLGVVVNDTERRGAGGYGGGYGYAYAESYYAEDEVSTPPTVKPTGESGGRDGVVDR